MLRKKNDDFINGNCLSKERKAAEIKRSKEFFDKQEFVKKPVYIKQGVTGKKLK